MNFFRRIFQSKLDRQIEEYAKKPIAEKVLMICEDYGYDIGIKSIEYLIAINGIDYSINYDTPGDVFKKLETQIKYQHEYNKQMEKEFLYGENPNGQTPKGLIQ